MTTRLPSIGLVVSFLNEERFLPVFLRSLAAQTLLPAQVVLVDDGSTDASGAITRDFAGAHPWALAVSRPQRPQQRDRLVSAAELSAFQWGLAKLSGPLPDVVAKMDADLELSPSLCETVANEFAGDPALGIAGSFLSERGSSGALSRDAHPPDHVRGANKFYRRECLEEISPVPTHLGWDTIDEFCAQRAGWRTRSLDLPDGDCVHLRPTGGHGGRLRAYRRWGECAWGYGAAPSYVLLGAVARGAQRPVGLAGLNYLVGWGLAGVRRRPRAERSLRHFVRARHRADVGRRMRALLGRGRADARSGVRARPPSR